MEKRNISVSKKNGYTLEKVLKAKQYLEEIGSNKRNFPFEKLVKYFNELHGTNDPLTGCRCQSPKYYNGIANFYKFGKLTLINNGLATESDFDLKKEEPKTIENEANRIDLGAAEDGNPMETQNNVSEASEEVVEDKVEDTKEEENEAPTEPKKSVGRPKKNVVK